MDPAEIAFVVLFVIFCAACVVFFSWWTYDIYRTTLAIQAAKTRLNQIGISTEAKLPSRDISELLRAATEEANTRTSDHDIFLLLASLYLLRRDLKLNCLFFVRELRALPPFVLKRLHDNSRQHIEQSDIRKLICAVPSKLASRIAERFEENIRDLGKEIEHAEATEHAIGRQRER